MAAPKQSAGCSFSFGRFVEIRLDQACSGPNVHTSYVAAGASVHVKQHMTIWQARRLAWLPGAALLSWLPLTSWTEHHMLRASAAAS